MTDCSNVCFSIQVSFYCIVSVFGIIVMLKNEAAASHMLYRWYFYYVYKSINLDEIPNTTGRNAAASKKVTKDTI